MSVVRARRAVPDDSAAIAGIYNQCIQERTATFETRPRDGSEIVRWFDGRHPIVVAEAEGRVVGFASTSTYRDRDCYSGIAEFSVYVSSSSRGKGTGTLLMGELISESRRAGFWKLVSRVFVDNAASRAMLRTLRFREVGIYEKHGRLDGVWRDVVIVELLIADRYD